MAGQRRATKRRRGPRAQAPPKGTAVFIQRNFLVSCVHDITVLCALGYELI
nr:hypothetical protein Iba_chr02bCG15170 [Ipomoea batatas]